MRGHRCFDIGRALAVLVALATLLNCNGAEVREASVAIDTLDNGRIVVRNSPDAGSGPLHLERRLRLGSVDGGGPASFGKVFDVAIGPDTLIYILDGMAAEVRVFGLEGRHVRTIGGQGEGPGELALPYAIAFDAQGQLWVVDERQRKYTVYDRSGHTVKILRRPIRWPVTTGELVISPDGLIQEFGWWGSGPGGNIRMRVSGDVVEVVDSVPLPPFSRPFFRRGDDERIGMAVPFAARQSAAVGGSGAVWTAHGSTYRLAELTSAGDTARLVELRVTAAPFSDAERSAIDDSIRMSISRGIEVDRDLVPESHPFITAITIADNGEIWVRRPSEQAPPTGDTGVGCLLDVFDAVGRYIGTTSAPVDAFPAPQISHGYLAGVVRDELGVDYVEVYAVVR